MRVKILNSLFMIGFLEGFHHKYSISFYFEKCSHRDHSVYGCHGNQRQQQKKCCASERFLAIVLDRIIPFFDRIYSIKFSMGLQRLFLKFLLWIFLRFFWLNTPQTTHVLEIPEAISQVKTKKSQNRSVIPWGHL